MDTSEAIGRRIAQARKEAGGISQQELADVLGVTKRAVQAYEDGTTIPWRHFPRMQELLGKSLSWFLEGRETAPAPAMAEVLCEIRDVLRTAAHENSVAHQRALDALEAHHHAVLEALQSIAADVRRVAT